MAPAAWNPSVTCPTNLATPSARSWGDVVAVDPSNRSWASTSAFGASPANSGSRVAHPRGLSRLALAAVRRAPHRPRLGPAHGVAGAPELRGDPRVVGISVQLGQPAVLDPPGHLAPELEVDPLVVDGPRPVGGHEQ